MVAVISWFVTDPHPALLVAYIPLVSRLNRRGKRSAIHVSRDGQFTLRNNFTQISNSVWTVWFFICYIIKTNLYIFLLTNQAVITGIVFMLINVRIGMGWNQKRDQAVSTFRISPRAEQGTDTIYNLHPMAVNITQTVDYRTTEDTDVASQNELEHKV